MARTKKPALSAPNPLSASGGSFSASDGTHSGHERLIALERTGFGRTDLAGMSPADLKTLFEQLSLLRGHGFTADELRTMPRSWVALEYAQAVRNGATPGEPPPAGEVQEAGAAPEAGQPGARAAPEPGEAGAGDIWGVIFGVWPQPQNPLFQIDGPVAQLLKGLRQSPRNHDELRLTEALGAIGFIVDGYRQPTHPLHDRSLPRQRHCNAKQRHRNAEQKELDKFYEKAIKLATDIPGSDVLRHNWVSGREDDRLPDLVALLATLDNFTGFVAATRKRLVGKRGPKTQRHLVEQIIEIIEEYIGAKVKRSIKRGTPADVVRKIVEIMDAAIDKGTIDGALRARSKAFGEIKRRKR
jgi:hypothetical protein